MLTLFMETILNGKQRKRAPTQCPLQAVKELSNVILSDSEGS